MDNINILYINLAHRTERNLHIQNELKRMNLLNFQRFEAIQNKECGHIGCGLSHINCLEIAKKNNWEQVLILEDDFTFIKDKKYIFENYDRIKNTNWDVLMLAGNLNKSKHKYEKIDNVFSIAKETATTSGYIVKKSFYDALINNFKEAVEKMKDELKEHKIKMSKMDPKKIRTRWNSTSRSPAIMLQNNCTAIDRHWWILQEKFNFFIFNPHIGIQNKKFNRKYKGNDT